MRLSEAALLGLALLAPLVEAAKVETTCETVRVAGTRVWTRYLPTYTAYTTVVKRPLATVHRTYVPEARTMTKVVVTVATEVMRAAPATGIITSTSTNFVISVPTTTLTQAPYQPTHTQYALLPPTTTIKTTVTSYTADAPSPTLAGTESKRSLKRSVKYNDTYDDDDEDDDDEDDDEDDDDSEEDGSQDGSVDQNALMFTTMSSNAEEDTGMTPLSATTLDEEKDTGIRPMAASNSIAEQPTAVKPLVATSLDATQSIATKPTTVLPKAIGGFRTRIMMNFDGYAGPNPGAQTDVSNVGRVARRAHRGRQVICTPTKRVTATVTRKATVTVTETRRVRRPTTTVTSTSTATITTTNFPSSMTQVVRMRTTMTFTARPVTVTFKPTLEAVTVTKTLSSNADPPRQTTVLDLYSICDPARQYDLKFWTRSPANSYVKDFSSGTTSSPELCCQSIADTPGAVAWAWVRQPEQDSAFVRGTCYGVSVNLRFDSEQPDLADQCVPENPASQVKIVTGTQERGGLLQCGLKTYS